jgi:aryl-alcohol dehydrogenase-like predicted oxidoreductase
MQFGWTAEEEASFQVLDAYVESGGNFIDTADIYSSWAPGNPGGVSEEIIGRWMKARGNRERIVLATKVRGRMWDGPDGEGLSRAHIERAIEDSLRRLQVETIDLYQCHWPDEDVPIEETLAVFGELIAAGKVRYIGASNYSAHQLQLALDASRTKGLPRFVALQPHYNLVDWREYEGPLANLCLRESIGVIPYSPLPGGFLTGKYQRDSPSPKTPRASGVQKYMTDGGFAVVNTLRDVAEAHGTTPAAVAVAWLLTRPAVVSPIVGANSVQQWSEIAPAAELRLSADDIERLESVSAAF